MNNQSLTPQLTPRESARELLNYLRDLQSLEEFAAKLPRMPAHMQVVCRSLCHAGSKPAPAEAA